MEERLLTLRDLAREIKQDREFSDLKVFNLRYAICTANELPPRQVVGVIRLYGREQIDEAKALLRGVRSSNRGKSRGVQYG